MKRKSWFKKKMSHTYFLMTWGGVLQPSVMTRGAQGCGGGYPPLGLLERDISSTKSEHKINSRLLLDVTMFDVIAPKGFARALVTRKSFSPNSLSVLCKVQSVAWLFKPDSEILVFGIKIEHAANILSSSSCTKT